MNKDKYYKYQMTFPFEGNKIYKSKSLSKVVKKCYKDYKKFSDINEGLFCVTNIDKDIEYRFQVKNHKIIKIKKKQEDGDHQEKIKLETKEILENMKDKD